MAQTLLPADALNRLLSVLHARNILLGRDDIGWAFTSLKTATETTQYVQRYISEENLLTLEEKEVYENLRSQLTRKDAMPLSLLPKTEEQIQQDIGRLEAETVQLKRQIDTFHQQRKLLSLIEKGESAQQIVQRTDNEGRKRRYVGEREQLSMAVEEILADISSIPVTKDRHVQGKASFTSQAPKINECLKSDDRLLDRVQKMLSQSSAPNVNAEKEVFKRLEDSSSNLTALKAAVIRTKLDRIFIEQSYDEFKQVNVDESTNSEQLQVVLHDLNSLHNDINDVSRMVTNEVYHHPTRYQLEETHLARIRDMATRYEYILSVLSQLSERNVTMTSILKKDTIRSVAMLELRKRIEHASNLAPEFTLIKTNSSPFKRVVTVATPGRHGQRQVVPQTPSTSSEQNRQDSVEVHLRRLLGLPLDQTTKLEVDDIVTQRMNKASLQETSNKYDMREKLESTLGDLGGMLYILEDAVWSDTKWLGSGFQIQDEILKKALHDIEETVKGVGAGVARLTDSARNKDDREKEAFIKKWT